MRLTRKGFKAWLEGLHPRTKVAREDYAGWGYSGPFERYCNSVGCLVPTVLPSWANKFYNQLDIINSSMSAGRALKVLEETSGRAAVV